MFNRRMPSAPLERLPSCHMSQRKYHRVNFAAPISAPEFVVCAYDNLNEADKAFHAFVRRPFSGRWNIMCPENDCADTIPVSGYIFPLPKADIIDIRARFTSIYQVESPHMAKHVKPETGDVDVHEVFEINLTGRRLPVVFSAPKYFGIAGVELTGAVERESPHPDMPPVTVYSGLRITLEDPQYK
jgi:hypothetical protein